jgi:hypothetical protein
MDYTIVPQANGSIRIISSTACLADVRLKIAIRMGVKLQRVTQRWSIKLSGSNNELNNYNALTKLVDLNINHNSTLVVRFITDKDICY